LLGAYDIQVFSNHFFKEDPSGYWSVQNLGQREFDLQDGEIVAVSCLAVSACEGVRQTSQPFPQQGVDFLRRECITKRLQPPRMLPRENAVVEGLVGDILLVELTFYVFVPISSRAWRYRGSRSRTSEGKGRSPGPRNRSSIEANRADLQLPPTRPGQVGHWELLCLAVHLASMRD